LEPPINPGRFITARFMHIDMCLFSSGLRRQAVKMES
jgi:hypothetical protein